MAGKIIHLQPAHFSFEKRGGYNVILPEIIAQFFEYMRGIGPDAFIIKSYTFSEGNTGPSSTEIMRGCVPTEAIDRKSIRQAQLSLEAELDSQAEEASRRIKGRTSRVFQNRNHGNDVVYVRCRNGIMGCGWYDSAHTVRKGLKMAAFMLYALGTINGDTDETLLTAIYNYLPYDSELSSSEADKATDIIVRVLTDKALQQNSPFRRPYVTN
jgi:hypothetical protein